MDRIHTLSKLESPSEDFEQRGEVDVLQNIIDANAEVGLLSKYSPEILKKLVLEGKGDEEFESFLGNFQRRIVSLIPFVQRGGGLAGVGKEVRGLFERVLGYEIVDGGGDGGGGGKVERVHLQRVSDILGPEAMGVITRGFVGGDAVVGREV